MAAIAVQFYLNLTDLLHIDHHKWLTFVKHMILCQAPSATTTNRNRNQPPTMSSPKSTHPDLPSTSSSSSPDTTNPTRRSMMTSTILASTFLGKSVVFPTTAAAENWGSRSYIKEKYFQPEISPEDAVARIQQTADGMREMRHMLDTMAWRYVLRYIRLKMAYLSSDLKNAMTLLPENRRASYVTTANQLVDNMTELDIYIRTPKVYESYVFYEKTLKSLDEIVAMLA